ncbi:hypothetical protein CC78DRAFT_583258 [Lojkania enalia]|uniref:Uncharacterized protein n=1 Tax=Lojkania enalia TaxID=147567 RepID=A0A9P4K423_9PLEO|nr:hypothetical protein CC78DRAFT_583258 [Didymosphaeria enalia]
MDTPSPSLKRQALSKPDCSPEPKRNKAQVRERVRMVEAGALYGDYRATKGYHLGGGTLDFDSYLNALPETFWTTSEPLPLHQVQASIINAETTNLEIEIIDVKPKANPLLRTKDIIEVLELLREVIMDAKKYHPGYVPNFMSIKTDIGSIVIDKANIQAAAFGTYLAEIQEQLVASQELVNRLKKCKAETEVKMNELMIMAAQQRKERAEKLMAILGVKVPGRSRI